jgi:hypothetical protein
MPNWCNNTMTISHPDPAMVQKAADAWNSGAFLDTLIPCPSELRETVKGWTNDEEEQKAREEKQKSNIEKYGYPTWYEYSVAEWGTKWDVGISEYEEPVEVSGNSFSVGFCSAWSPPTGGYAKLREMGYEICAYYYESGCDFCGRWIDGQDDCYEVSRGGIPQDIVDEMGIDEAEECE